MQKVITRVEDLPDLSEFTALVLDTETSGVNPALADRPAGVVVGPMSTDDGYYIVLYNSTTKGEQVSREEFVNWWQSIQDKTMVMHNAKFDLKMLRKIGCECTGKVVDTMVAAYVFDGSAYSYALDRLSSQYLPGFEHVHYKAVQDWLSKNQPVKQTGEGETPQNYSLIPLEILSLYALEDCEITRELMKVFQKQPMYDAIENFGCESWNTRRLLQNEMELVKVIFNMEDRGVLIDRERLVYLQEKAEGEVEYYKQLLCKAAGFTFEPSQWGKLEKAFVNAGGRVMFWTKKKDGEGMFKKGKQKSDQFTTVKEESTGRPNWNGAAILNYLQIFKEEKNEPAFNFVKNYREVMSRDRILSTFVRPISRYSDFSGVLHGQFNQTTTITSRLSSSGPNLQNLAKTSGSQDQKALEKFLGVKDTEALNRQIRSLYVARPGTLLCSIDWSQIEYRMAVWASQDNEMIQRWIDNPNLDFHQDTSDLIGIDREVAKTSNFADLYGAGAKSLAMMLTLVLNREVTVQEAKNWKDQIHRARPAMTKLMKDITRLAERQGYVQNICGVIAKVDRDLAYKGLNYRIQGDCGSWMRNKLVEMDKFIKQENLPVEMLLTIHDEVVFSVPEETNLMREICLKLAREFVKCPFMKIPVTCDIEVGKRWSDAAPLECWCGNHIWVEGVCKKCKQKVGVANALS